MVYLNTSVSPFSSLTSPPAPPFLNFNQCYHLSPSSLDFKGTVDGAQHFSNSFHVLQYSFDLQYISIFDFCSTLSHLAY